MATNPCRRCGRDVGPGLPQPNRCSDCPPRPCADCGEPDNAPCACYVSVDDLALADLKSLFARSDLSLDLEKPR